MNKTTLCTLVLLISGSCVQATGADCASPTNYVMQYLKMSSTLNLGSDIWKTNIQEKGTRADTVFARTHDTSGRAVVVYTGIPARMYDMIHARAGWYNSVDAASGNFTLTHNGGTIEINSHIKNTEIHRKPVSVDSNTLISALPGKTAVQDDNYTTCIHTERLIFHDNPERLESTIYSECATKIPLAQFLAAVLATK